MLRLRTFGSVALVDDDRVLDGPMTQRRRLALLALLAAAGDRAVSRDKLVGYLWPESEESKARHALSQWLFLLRKDLPPGALAGTDELRLDATALPSDVATFREALARGDLETAVGCYDGPFLDGFHLTGTGEFDRWADEQRRELATRWRDAAEQLARQRLDARDTLGAVALWRRLAADDPTNARIAVGLMEALDRAGDRAGALAHARVHAAVQREQLDLPPDPSVEKLTEQLRTATNSAATPPAATNSTATNVTATESPVGSSPDRSSPSKTKRRVARLVGVAATLVVGCGAAAYVMVPAEQRPTLWAVLTRESAQLAPRRVVVAPLDNQTNDSTLSAFGEMVADYTTRALDGIGEYTVWDARTAAATARVVDQIPRLLRSGDIAVAVAREVGASMVVSGRYYRDRDSLRVHVQLTDAATGRLVRTLGVVSGRADDPVKVVASVSRRAAALLVAAVDTTPAGIGVGLTSPPSYDAYRETIAAWDSYYQAHLPRALEHAARAAALDSTYVLPWVMAAYFRTELRDMRVADSLLRAAAKLPATPSRVESTSLEMLRADVRGDLESEMQLVQELARLTPGSAEMIVHAAHIAVLSNRPHAALATLQSLDPNRGVLLFIPFYWNWRAAALHELGEHHAELDAARRGTKQFPLRNAVWFNLVRALGANDGPNAARDIRAIASKATTERWEAAAVRRRMLVEGSRELRAHGRAAEARPLLDSALAEFEALSARTGGDTSVALLDARAVLLAEAGRFADARAAATRLLALDARRIAALGVLGVVAARTGDRAAALRTDSTLAAITTGYPLGRQTLWRARIAAALGDRPQAVTLVERAHAEGFPILQGIAVQPGDAREFDYAETLVHADPFLESIWGEPGFQRLLAPRG